MKVLVINSGSSSIKYKFFQMPQEKLISQGVIEHIGEKGSSVSNHYKGIRIVLSQVSQVDAIGHRVVHGAEKFRRPVLINAAVIAKIKDCCMLAPLHNPENLGGILACKKLLSGIKQVAVFDTAFHQTMPAYAFIYGLPYEYYRRFGIRKYGFHGTSHEYVASEAARILKRPLARLKIITCHLGNGCSITAVAGGRSADTSMGFTPLEGLVMGTRCGDIDPALLTFLMRKKRFNIAQIDDILNKQSGLIGISGISNDMRRVSKEANAGSMRAKLAVDIFIYRIKKYIGAYTAIMGGIDAVVFCGGIGENQAGIRQEICRDIFSAFKKSPRVLVIPTNEELMIARAAYRVAKG